MGSRREMEHGAYRDASRRRWLATVTVALIVATVCLVAAGLRFDNNRTSREASNPPGFLSEQLDRGKAVSLIVMGDSTGFRPNYWVDRIAQKISADYERPVVLSKWNRETVAYDPPTSVAVGKGEPVTIWNASAPGEPPRYFQEHLGAVLAPVEQPDFIFINHGHNTGPDPVLDISRLTSRVRERFPNVPIGLTVQNPYLGQSVEVADTRAAEVRSWAMRQQKFTVIDVYGAYRASTDIDSLYVDERHPSDAGSELWAQTVIEALGLR